jgi:hypothetical protein
MLAENQKQMQQEFMLEERYPKPKPSMHVP